MESLGFFQPVGRHDQNADSRRHSRGQHSSKNPHSHRKHKYVIQNDIGKASSHRSSHGKPRIPVIADEAQKHIIHNKSRGKNAQNF